MLTDPNLQAASICSYPGDISDHPYQVQFEAFYKAIDEGRGMPLPAWLMLSKLMNWLLLLTNLPIIIKRKNKKLIFIKVLIIKYL
jgi:hypothetical protein